MVDDAHIEQGTGLIPTQTAITGQDSGSEAEAPTTIDEVMGAFAARKLRIKIFKVSRILFDPKQLPGVTPEESFDFLLKGLQIEGDEADRLRGVLGPRSKRNEEIVTNFPDFIDALSEQNINRTVADIWRAADADPFTKIALQWEVQDPEKQYADVEYWTKNAGSVAEDLRKLDTLLKKLHGAEIFLQYSKFGMNINFMALTTADEKGINFIQRDPKSPYRDVELGGPSAFSENLEDRHITIVPHLVIPFIYKEVLQSKSADDWGTYKDNFWRMREYPFDPNNPFPGITTGDELYEQTGRNSSFYSEGYKKLKYAMKAQSSET